MNDFIDFISRLAPEGETALFVKQKPRLVNGQPTFHGDGSQKYTWPPSLPAKYDGKGAWYGNTGSFILSRFEDGKLSASSSNCEYVLCMVLDDIGTKSKVPPLEPTWKIETSTGNYQWGYAFGLDDQPSTGEFCAAIKAIAAAGFTDGGAINAVRNFRLPGSVNLKNGKDGFVSTLVEFHPEREFSLRQICEALQVVPEEASTAKVQAVRLEDDGQDTILRWLNEQGLVLSGRNPEGWYSIACPNKDEHSDGNPEARYHPVTRSFSCFHEHCGDLTSSRFLAWTAENGAPAVHVGLRDDLLAATMADTLSKIAPTQMFPDKAADIIEEVERKELGRVERSGWYERFAYIQDDDAYFDLIDRREISRGTFNALFRHIDCRSIHGDGKRKVEASVCYDEHRQSMGARCLVGVTYAAGEDVQVARDSLPYGNRWRNARQPCQAGDVTPWLKHVERMIPEAFEREHVLNVLAYKLQHPNRKINHAILHAGKPGAGKDSLYTPFLWAMGGPQHVNVSMIRNEELNSTWGYALEAEVMVINELRQAEAKDRRALENNLKPLIAAPPELLPINRKGLHPYMALNRLFVLAYSNERAAISLPSDDRRWFVVWSEADRMTDAESSKLWAWYERGGMSAVGAWLYARDVIKFNPGATPPMTEAKQVLISLGLSTAESYLVDLLQSRKGPFVSGVIGSPFHAVCDQLVGFVPAGVKVPQAALLHALREAGWIDRGRVATHEFQTKKHIFCAPDFETYNKSDLRRMVEPLQDAPNIVPFKR
jgi:hypothetical protein